MHVSFSQNPYQPILTKAAFGSTTTQAPLNQLTTEIYKVEKPLAGEHKSLFELAVKHLNNGAKQTRSLLDMGRVTVEKQVGQLLLRVQGTADQESGLPVKIKSLAVLAPREGRTEKTLFYVTNKPENRLNRGSSAHDFWVSQAPWQPDQHKTLQQYLEERFTKA